MTINRERITDDLDAMLAVFPPDLAEAVRSNDNFDQLVEVILDQGRQPTARFFEEEVVLLEPDIGAGHQLCGGTHWGF